MPHGTHSDSKESHPTSKMRPERAVAIAPKTKAHRITEDEQETPDAGKTFICRFGTTQRTGNEKNKDMKTRKNVGRKPEYGK